MLVERLLVCGVGLIGASVAWAVRKSKLAREVIGWDRSRRHLEFALTRGIISKAASSSREAAEGSELVVLATPVMAMPTVLRRLVKHLPDNAIVTDVGSVKIYVINSLEPLLGQKMTLVPAHPLAGKESSGPQAADPNLFKGARVVITPSTRTEASALTLVEKMWLQLGAVVEKLSPEVHDRLLAHTSHLPQVAASALALTVGKAQIDSANVLDYCASGFRDTTRLALSDSQMWRDICITNRKEIVRALTAYETSIRQFIRLIETADSKKLEQLFDESQRLRRRLR